MKHKTSSSAGKDDRALQDLLRVRASRDRKTALQLIAERPSLARSAVTVGASRQGANSYFLRDVGHYTYTGDTPLHIAAAAHEREIVEELVSRGADVKARN